MGVNFYNFTLNTQTKFRKYDFLKIKIATRKPVFWRAEIRREAGKIVHLSQYQQSTCYEFFFLTRKEFLMVQTFFFFFTFLLLIKNWDLKICKNPAPLFYIKHTKKLSLPPSLLENNFFLGSFFPLNIFPKSWKLISEKYIHPCWLNNEQSL